MSLRRLLAPPNGFRVAAVDLPHAPLFCLALLMASCAVTSFALACATPFPAFAVIAAAMLAPQPALFVVTGAWLVNQAIGFGALHYPLDENTVLWGLAIGAAALVATLTAVHVLQLVPRGRTPLALALTLICAYGAYETTLFAATPFLGGSASFTATIIARLALLNAAWLIALVLACGIARQKLSMA